VTSRSFPVASRHNAPNRIEIDRELTELLAKTSQNDVISSNGHQLSEITVLIVYLSNRDVTRSSGCRRRPPRSAGSNKPIGVQILQLLACSISTILCPNSLIGADVPLSNKQTSRAAGFRCFRKTGRGADDVTESGRLFHARAAATEKARSPIVKRAVSGTIRDLMLPTRRCTPQNVRLSHVEL